MGRFKIVLYHPEIPGNTGSIGRTAVALELDLILIKPYGFDISEKAVRRAGLDYWKYVSLTEYDSWEEFLAAEKPENEMLYFMSKKASNLYYDAKFRPNSYIIFGAETSGLPKEFPDKFPNRFFKMPMYSDKIRSLNLSNAATAVAYEAIRQINYSKES